MVAAASAVIVIPDGSTFDEDSPGKGIHPLRWRHNGRDSVSNHQPHDCLVNYLFRSRSKKTSKLRVTGLCAGNSTETGEFPAQMASNAENVSIDDVIMILIDGLYSRFTAYYNDTTFWSGRVVIKNNIGTEQWWRYLPLFPELVF